MQVKYEPEIEIYFNINRRSLIKKKVIYSFAEYRVNPEQEINCAWFLLSCQDTKKQNNIKKQVIVCLSVCLSLSVSLSLYIYIYITLRNCVHVISWYIISTYNL